MPSLLTPQIITLIAVLLFALGAVAIVSVFGLKARRAALEVIQRALDKGERLDPGLIEALAGRRPTRRKLLFPAIMTIALGVGVGLSGVLVAASPDELYERLGNGVILVCLGVGLFVSSRFDEPDRRR